MIASTSPFTSSPGFTIHPWVLRSCVLPRSQFYYTSRDFSSPPDTTPTRFKFDSLCGSRVVDTRFSHKHMLYYLQGPGILAGFTYVKLLTRRLEIRASLLFALLHIRYLLHPSLLRASDPVFVLFKFRLVFLLTV